MSRGGPHNRGKLLAHNTSGLAAIRFRWRSSRSSGLLYPTVVVAWYERQAQRQRTYSVLKHGQAGALELALRARRRAGYPTPPLKVAIAALRRFLRAE
ncbi:MAG: hypothetical protein QM702_00155 [Rubrivivax sp.]